MVGDNCAETLRRVATGFAFSGIALLKISILGFSEILQDEISDRKSLKYLKGINIAGKNLLNLINDILDLSKIEETKENRITLITCVENMPEYRLCIQAEEIKKG